MDNEQLLDLLQNKPKGLFEKLKYFEYELSKLEKEKGNSDLRRRITREIDNLRYDISVYEEILNEVNTEMHAEFKKGQTQFEETHSIINEEIDNYPYKKVLPLAGLIGVSIALLIQSIIISNYILLIVSLIIFSVSTYFYYRKSKISELDKGMKNLKNTADLMEKIVEKTKLIETLKQEIFFAQKRKKNNVHGTHQDNRSWLEENFNALKNGSIKIEELANDETLAAIKKIKGKEGSENLIAKQLAEVYFEKFNSIISPDQIKGMVIYKNR